MMSAAAAVFTTGQILEEKVDSRTRQPSQDEAELDAASRRISVIGPPWEVKGPLDHLVLVDPDQVLVHPATPTLKTPPI
jgi:hypothetical protein